MGRSDLGSHFKDSTPIMENQMEKKPKQLIKHWDYLGSWVIANLLRKYN